MTGGGRGGRAWVGGEAPGHARTGTCACSSPLGAAPDLVLLGGSGAPPPATAAPGCEVKRAAATAAAEAATAYGDPAPLPLPWSGTMTGAGVARCRLPGTSGGGKGCCDCGGGG